MNNYFQFIYLPLAIIPCRSAKIKGFFLYLDLFRLIVCSELIPLILILCRIIKIYFWYDICLNKMNTNPFDKGQPPERVGRKGVGLNSERRDMVATCRKRISLFEVESPSTAVAY